jgi:uncharacterized protein YigA (DUF484 family)|tara:strand:- start:622 stop:1368 length:747 start_codon:yes stop_codon:yes gene_type:complete
MSQQNSQDTDTHTLSEEDVAKYLNSHPGFFEERPGLLMDLKLSHHSGSNTVSLVERQVDVLRQGNSKLRRQLKEIVAVAKDNHVVLEKIHQLAVTLIKSKSSMERIKLLEVSLKKNFLADHAALIIFSSDAHHFLSNSGFTKIIDHDDKAFLVFASFLQTNRPRCGQLQEDQKIFAFEDDASEINSAALIPLGESEKLGFLIIGSTDSDHFNPGEGMDFLGQLGELVTAALLSDVAIEATSGTDVAGS